MKAKDQIAFELKEMENDTELGLCECDYCTGRMFVNHDPDLKYLTCEKAEQDKEGVEHGWTPSKHTARKALKEFLKDQS